MLSLVLMILSIILFLLAAFRAPVPYIDPVAMGLALWGISILV
jgi:hypothetical protein